MSKKFFFIGTLALLGASLFLLGCPTEAEETIKEVPYPDYLHVEAAVTDEAGLITELGRFNVIEFAPTATVTLATVVEIPAGKTVIIRGDGSKSVTPKATDGLAIKGTVYVELGGVLVATVANPVTVTGTLNVVKGTLSIDKATSVPTGASINGGTLAYSVAPADIADVATALGRVTKGQVVVPTAITSSTPATISEGVKNAVSADKVLEITADANEANTTTTLTIPAGLVLTAKSGDTLEKVTTLTVNGSLTADAGTLEALTTVSGTGSITAEGEVPVAALAKLAAVSTLTSFVGTTEIDAALTVNGTVVLLDNVSLEKAATISGANAVLALATSKKITLGAADAKIAGTGYEIVPANNETTGTLDAGTASTVVAFTAAGIEGYTSTGRSLVTAAIDPTSAATLTFSTKDSELKVTGAATIGGVILDVSTNGKITVVKDKTLTLSLGTGAGHIGSGGIFTKASTAKSAVKANAATQNSTADITLVKAGTAKVEKAAEGTAGNLATGNASTDVAAGVIDSASAVTIDKNDTFAVTGTKIAVTSGT
jgi:hypothetical protein